jgi:ribokinase
VSAPRLRLAVVGHVEHVTLGRVPAIPRPGEIVHMDSLRTFAGGGGGVALWQLAKSPAEVHLFTALGDDEAGRQVEADLASTGARVHAVRRARPHNRSIAMITPDGDRTIVLAGEPLHPRGDDPLPWELLVGLDGVYFTSDDPAALRLARSARVLAVTARRRPAIAASGVRAADYPVPPDALVLTDGARGGRIETAAGTLPFAAPPPPPPPHAAYGAGDSFAAALLFFLALGLDVATACARAGPFGAAVLRGPDPRLAQLPLAP